MPIGFEANLQTNAQFVSGLNKGAVDTDHLYGGIRGKIDNWTNLHLDTVTQSSVERYVFQDDGTAAAPGNFKEYSTILFVADGRALVEDANAASDFIRLDASGNFVASGGTKYVVNSSGTAEAAFFVLIDATQVGGAAGESPNGDALPTFTITGTQGSGSTALPAGYAKISSEDDTIGSGGFTSWTVKADDNNTEAITDGVTVDFTGGTAITTTYDASTNILTINHDDTSTDSGVGAQTGASVISTLTLDTHGHVTATATRNLSAGDIGLGSVENAAASGLYVKLDGTSTIAGSNPLRFEGTTADASETIIAVTDPTGDRTIKLPDATGTVALTANKLSDFAATTSAELKTVISDETGSGSLVFSSSPTFSGTVSAAAISTTGNVSVGGNLTVTGNVIQQESTTVTFEDSYLNLNVPTASGVYQNGTYSSDAGLYFTRKIEANAITEFSAFHYDGANDLFKFTTHGSSVTGLVGSADNVTALKFTVTDTNVQADQDDTTTAMAVTDEANASSVRSLGAVAKCTIDITSETTNAATDDNFAPEKKAAGGYPIKHNLSTQSVIVHAIQTHNSSGVALADPVSIICKYIPEADDTVRVFLPRVQEDEKYDIIVIG